MTSIRLAGLLIALTSLLLGCRPAGTTVSTGADIRGKITDIQQADAQSREEGTIGFLLIEGAIEEDTGYDKASVTITDKTRILKQTGQDRRPVTFEALEVGQRVEARFTGPVLESYPVQATASEIVILE